MKYINFVLSGIVLLCATGLPGVALAQTTPTENKPVPQVAIITVAEDVALVRKVLGIVFAPQTQTISSQVTAVVTSDRLGMGTRVQKGEVVVSLDSREADAKLELAQSEVISARINLEKQTLDFNRVKQTYEKKLISKADYDNAKLALRKANNDLKGFEAKFEVAKLFVEKHRITAPFSGVLMSNTPVVGLQLAPGQEVVKILNSDDLRIKTSLSRDELVKISQGQAQLNTGNQSDTSLRLLHAAPNASETNGMFEVEFEIITQQAKTFTNKQPKRWFENQLADYFYSGQALTLTLFENKIHIPEQAVVQSADGEYVMAVNDDKVVKVALSELTVGQQVVVQGPHHLMPGDKVSILALEEFM